MAEKKAIAKKRLALIGVAVILIIFVSVIWASYNNLVRKNVDVDRAWADVQVQYQKRIDLIPNLVGVVESYAEFEKTTLTQITALRSQWMQQSGNPEVQVQTANQIEGALKTIFALAENYPDLKASQQFVSLQDNLAEVENMISVARRRYNEAVRDYNIATMVFPSNFVAGMFGFKQRTFFAAEEGAEKAPKININIT